MDSSKVIKLIRKLIREEVQKAVKPIVNEILAERFIRVLGQQKTNGNSSLTSVLGEVTSNNTTDTTEEEKLMKRRAYEKQKLQEKINAISGGDPMAKMIFEDIDDKDRVAINNSISVPNGAYIDMDDEGVDLSKFGL